MSFTLGPCLMIGSWRFPPISAASYFDGSFSTRDLTAWASACAVTAWRPTAVWPKAGLPTPPGVWIDLHMWRKFLARNDMKVGTRMAITAVVLMNVMRKKKSMKTRARESERWFNRVSNESERAKLVEAAWRSIVNKELEQEELLRSAKRSDASG